jgi:hypothetical protein
LFKTNKDRINERKNKEIVGEREKQGSQKNPKRGKVKLKKVVVFIYKKGKEKRKIKEKKG